MDAGQEFIRYQAAEPNARGARIGIFGLANALAGEGVLSREDYEWWRSSNTWYNDAYPDPSITHPSVYDRGIHPYAQAWFKTSAGHLLAKIPGYLELLTRYGVRWEESRSSDPGRVLYMDDVQVVVDPYR
ncbi:hypothetical protein GD627_09605 [Arthrobacter yangruifuii]|uniref:Uncharacterized protein n=1 Tax=Arthrobacter yangruifuii TaxID=2606616 RepID=A0A5N6MHY2_9MICC|nr:hypothetical protein [Arthrobacter yangruifuii]KAD3633086.1 hypothetical protein GD627_09605 [Arthrobacter yangruifuii]